MVHSATVVSWGTPYIGKAKKALWNHITGHYTPDSSAVYAHYSAIIQSSGMGKSRLVHELALEHFCIPINLREAGSTGMPLCYSHDLS